MTDNTESQGDEYRGIQTLLYTNPERETIDALIFVVPGMGSRADLLEHLEQQFKPSKLAHGLVKWWDSGQVSQILLNNLRESLNSTGHGDRNVALCTIDYHTITREKIQFDDTLASITLPTVPYLRNMGNNTAIDVLMYCSGSAVRNSTLGVIRKIMRDVYGQVIADHPNVCDSVYIVGHSLGSVISFDIASEMEAAEASGQEHVSEHVLPFRPRALFFLGSPLGLFLLLRQGFHEEAPFESRENLLRNIPMYSVYHPLDPVAYRIEPLIDVRVCVCVFTFQSNKRDGLTICGNFYFQKRFTEIPPLKVPIVKESTVDKISSKITHLWMNFKHGSNGSSSKRGSHSQSTVQPQQTMMESLVSSINVSFSNGGDSHQHDENVAEVDDVAPLDSILPEADGSQVSKQDWIARYQRVDYELTVTGTVFNPYIMSGQSHLTYWSMRDVGLFISSRLVFPAKETNQEL